MTDRAFTARDNEFEPLAGGRLKTAEQDRAMRLECLRLAVELRYAGEDVRVNAERLFRYVNDGLQTGANRHPGSDPKDPHQADATQPKQTDDL